MYSYIHRAIFTVLASLTLPGFAATNVVINVSTQSATPLAPGFSGFNVPQLRNGVEYYDPKFVAAVAPLIPGAWLRFPGGTSSMAYDWNPADTYGGHLNPTWLNFLTGGPTPPVTGQGANVLSMSAQLTQAKGGVYLSDFATFAATFKSPTVICFNAYTDTNPASATLMAQAAQSAGVNVLEWELANEAYLYPAIFPNFAAYAAEMYNPYFQNIVSANPAATVGLFLAGQFPGNTNNYSAWDNGIPAYAPQYWNAISTHVYPITKTQSDNTTLETLNGILANGSSQYITSYVNPLAGSNTPIYITEFNCCAPDSDKFLSFLYNGIFLVEYIARMSTVPNVKAVGVNSLYTDNSDYHGLIQSVDDYESYLLGQLASNPNYSTDTATNPNTQFQFYTSAPGLALQVANAGIDNSSAVWATTVTGGPEVKTLGYNGSPIPAIYAQGYRGNNNRHYVVITNKSASTCSTTIKLNGTAVTSTMSVTTVSNSSPYVSNTAESQNNVTIQPPATSANPISIGPYSVTLVTW